MPTDRLAILVGHSPSRATEGARLLRSLLAHSRTDWRLYVGFFAPPETPIPNWCAHPRVTVRREWPAEGVSAGYNALAALGDEEWMAWLNDDAEVEPAWDAQAIVALRAHPAAGMAALPYLTPHAPFSYHVNQFPHGLLYANFGLLPRSIFHEVGGFDDRLRMYGSDNALCMRVQWSGRAIVVAEKARIIHHYRMDLSRRERMQRYNEECESWRSTVWPEWSPRVPRMIEIQGSVGQQPLELETPLTYSQRFGVTAMDAI